MSSQKLDTRDAAHWEAIEDIAELIQEGDYVRALYDLRELVKRDPTNPYAYYYMGTALFETENFEASRDAYRAATHLAPEYLGARVGLSHALRVLGDARSAIAEVKIAIEQFPQDGEARYALALAQAALGQRKQAKNNFEAYLETNPEFETSVEVRQILEMLGIGDSDEPLEIDLNLRRKN